MSVIKEPVMLDRTGRELIEVGKSIAAALWAEKSTLIPSKDVNLYDYDGTIVYSYTRAEFLGLDALPAFPAHEGLTAQGWNWTLADAKEYVGKYGILDIGQNYTTDNGKTRLYVEIGYPENLHVTLNYAQAGGSTVTINWGDGNTDTTTTDQIPSGNIKISHTYEAEGNYVIEMEVSDEGWIKLGTGTGTGTTLVAAGGQSFFRQGSRSGVSSTGRDALVGLEIGDRVTTIGSGAFYNCFNLKLVAIPATLTAINDLAFLNCCALKALMIPSGVTRIGNYILASCNYLKVVCIPKSATYLGIAALKSCITLERIVVPEGITALNAYTFFNCHGAAVINLPDTITGAIPIECFYECARLTEVRLPDGINAINARAFQACYNLRECVLPNGVTTIQEQAFSSCFGFTDFVIPSSVTSIKQFAFLYNDGANTFHVKAETPPTLEPTAFTSIGEPLTIYVPYSEDHSILAAYLAATGWSSKGDYIQEEVEA